MLAAAVTAGNMRYADTDILRGYGLGEVYNVTHSRRRTCSAHPSPCHRDANYVSTMLWRGMLAEYAEGLTAELERLEASLQPLVSVDPPAAPRAQDNGGRELV
jgi:hypothetical protein